MSEMIKLPRGLHRKIERSPIIQENSPCGICGENPFAYTCPRCNVKYCSRTCYQAQSHSTCAETFYRDCCLQSLGEVRTNDDEDREKVAKFLKADSRARGDAVETLGEEGLDGGDGHPLGDEFEGRSTTTTDLSERIGNLDLDDADDVEKLWDRLTAAEKADFETRLRSGEAADWVLGGDGGTNVPWWEAPLVIDEDAPASIRPPPEIYGKIKPLSTVTKVRPSPTIPNNLVNVLFAYCYVWRLYNGDAIDSAEESVADLTSLSDVLNRTENFPSVATSLCAAVTRLGSGDGGSVECGDALFCSNDFTASVMEDVAHICAKGKEAVARALSDSRTVFRRVVVGGKERKNSASTKKVREEKKLNLKTINGIVKKLEFYLSWVSEYGEEHLEGLAGSVDGEAKAYRRKIQSVQMETRVRETGEIEHCNLTS